MHPTSEGKGVRGGGVMNAFGLLAVCGEEGEHEDSGKKDTFASNRLGNIVKQPNVSCARSILVRACVNTNKRQYSVGGPRSAPHAYGLFFLI